MEHRVREEKRIISEIKKIYTQMYYVGGTMSILGIIGLKVFRETGNHFIHPVIYIMLCAMGFSTSFTALSIEISTKKKYKRKDKNNMSKTEAIVAMKEGKRITHEFFGSSEFLCMEYGIIRTEEGYNFEEGWDERVGPEWEKGWKIYGAA